MQADVFFTPGEMDPGTAQGAAAVVIDVCRATTTMVEALAHGAPRIFPTTSAEEAVKLASSLGREDTVLCGERKAVKIEGFDLGNSPGEFTREVIEGKRLVMSTTNGTPAIAAVHEARRVAICAFTNLGATASAIADEERLVLLCAGREGRFALEDALCAGQLLVRLGAGKRRGPSMNDAARAAVALAGAFTPDVAFLKSTAAGRSLDAIGLAGDLDICGDVDRHSVVVVMSDGALVVARD
ncbi:MAG: 2-phosphosulfolactate phosphatase [Gemmatimonadota bacterium]